MIKNNKHARILFKNPVSLDFYSQFLLLVQRFNLQHFGVFQFVREKKSPQNMFCSYFKAAKGFSFPLTLCHSTSYSLFLKGSWKTIGRLP